MKTNCVFTKIGATATIILSFVLYPMCDNFVTQVSCESKVSCTAHSKRFYNHIKLINKSYSWLKVSMFLYKAYSWRSNKCVIRIILNNICILSCGNRSSAIGIRLSIIYDDIKINLPLAFLLYFAEFHVCFILIFDYIVLCYTPIWNDKRIMRN